MSETSSNEKRLQKLRIALHLAGLAVALGIALVAGLVVYKPLHAEEARVRNLTTWTEKFMGSKDEVLHGSDELEKRRLESEILFAESMTRIPETAQKTEFLAQLSGLAADTGLKIHEFRPGDEIDRKTHRELSIHVTAEASYASLCRFLAGLEKVERLTQLTALQVNGGYGTAETYPVSMTVNIFFAPLPVNSEPTGEDDESESR
jgi:Tfp pilus assembly protein PilO